MKLLALHLTNVRKFTSYRASITGIGHGITVISEDNEFGKSTFFDATHALFFEKYSSSAKPVKSLQPYAGGAVEVAADVETDKGVFRVEKRFLSKKSAKISRVSDGNIIAQDDEAERWISTLLGTAHDGPAGLLWVRQGQLGLEADSAKEKSQLMENRRDLLSSVAGEIDTMTGGRRMDRVMRKVAQSLAEITTKTGRKAGQWKAVSDEADALGAALISVTAQVHTLDKALRDRKQAEASLARLDNPDTRVRRNIALATAKTAMNSTHAHAGVVKAAQHDHDLKALKALNAQGDLDSFLKAIDMLESAQTQAANSHMAMHAATIESQHLKIILTTAHTILTKTVNAVVVARRKLDTTRRQLSARKAKSEVTQLAQQITNAQNALGDRNVALAATKASIATPEWLGRAQEAQADVFKLTATFDAEATTLNIAYNGTARITQNGAIILGDHAIVLDGETRLDIAGFGTMTIHTKSVVDDSKSQLVTAQTILDDILSQASAANIHDARALAASRLLAEGQASLAMAILNTLAPNGIEALQAAKAEADLAAVNVNNAVLPTISELEVRVINAEEAKNIAQQKLCVADADYDIAREVATKAQTMVDVAKQTLDHTEAEAGPAQSRDKRQADYLRRQAQEQDAMVKAKANVQDLMTAAPDMDTAKAELKRAEDTIATNQQERAQVAERLAALSSEIRTLAGNGIEERRDELAGRQETACASQERFSQQAAALSRLQASLEAERNAARETYFGPIQEELKPLLSILYSDAALKFDSESLLPTGLIRESTQETLDDLSSGTKEQIAILTRLAFARLFARKGRHMPIILDDALIYSDDDRIIKMFTALNRVAQDQQIIVFSCRKLAFQDLGGARPNVEITKA